MAKTCVVMRGEAHEGGYLVAASSSLEAATARALMEAHSGNDAWVPRDGRDAQGLPEGVRVWANGCEWVAVQEVPSVAARTYLLFNGMEFDSSGVTLCDVDEQEWPNFEAIAKATGWTIVATMPGPSQWALETDISGVAKSEPIGVLVCPWLPDAKVQGHLYMPSIRSLVERMSGELREGRQHVPSSLPQNFLYAYTVLKAVATAQAEVASPHEARALYSAWRERSLGCSWESIQDGASPLAEKGHWEGRGTSPPGATTC